MAMAKLDALRDTLRGYGRVVVAFYGGVDSAFLLKIAAARDVRQRDAGRGGPDRIP